MDLFDLGYYFSQYVPLEVISRPLLKSAACAAAAKQLSLVLGANSALASNIGQRARMEQFVHPNNRDWAFVGAQYYDQAILLLVKNLAYLENPHEAPNASSVSRHDRAGETLAAAAILSIYEFSNHSNVDWDRHLSGTKTLFDIVEDEGILPLEGRDIGPQYAHQPIKPSIGRRATFWNFARQDCFAACKASSSASSIDCLT